MLAPLLLLLVVVPVVELFVLIQVGQELGVLWTIAVLLLASVVGVWLVKREGLGVMRRARQQLAAGRPPTREVLDGALILVAGGLLLVPGFVTDVLALALLLPPTRAAVRYLVLARLLGPIGPLVDGSSGQLGSAKVTEVRNHRREVK